jgi:hypothetical protein
MENTSVLLWAIGGGFAGTWIVLGFIYKMFDKIDAKFDKIDQRFDKLDEKITDIDRRLCRLEGAFSSKECCMLHHHDHRKAE